MALGKPGVRKQKTQTLRNLKTFLNKNLQKKIEEKGKNRKLAGI